MPPPTPILLPPILDLAFVLRGLAAHIWPGDGERYVVSAGAPPEHVEPVALVALAAWAMREQRRGATIGIDDSVKSRYTLSIGLLAALAGRLPWSDEVQADDDFYPLSRIAGERRVDAIPATVARTLHMTDAQAEGGLASSIHEIVRNAEEHAASETPAAFCAGWFRTQRRASFAVADNGIGILRHLRAKGVATLEDDDRLAIEKAIQPRVTGAGRRGEVHAPNNAGLGLHNTRRTALDTGGEMTILSGWGCHHESYSSGERWLDVEAPWQGTIVAVTLRTERKTGSRLSPLTLGTLGTGIVRWQDKPEGAVLFSPPVDAARFAMNKGWYKQQQPALAAAIASGTPVHVDFGGASYSTQSALHAFVAEVVRIHGQKALSLMTFSSGGPPLRDALRLVVTYALDAHVQD